MKKSAPIKVTGLLLLLSAAAILGAFPLWLDSPVRSNIHDPKSPKHTPVPVGTPSDTPTISPSPSITRTATQSNTFTPSPTPTHSATTTPTPVTVLYYDGESAGAAVSTGGSVGSSYDNSVSGTVGGINIFETSGTGAAGTTHFLSMTFSASAGHVQWGQVNFTNATSPMDVSAYDSLSFFVRIPKSACPGVLRAQVQLITNASGFPNDRSIPVTITSYLADGAQVLGYDQWVHVVVPLTAMIGPNWNPPGTFPASDLTAVTGVQFRGWEGSGNGTGMYQHDPTANTFTFPGTAQMDIDQISFLQGSAPAQRSFSPVFDDFQLTFDNLWSGGAWTADAEPGPCPVSGATPTSLIFPSNVATPPVDVSGDTFACNVGHFKGSLNSNPDATCNTTTGYADIYAFLNPFGQNSSVDLSGDGGNILAAFFPSGVHGLSVTLKVGAKTGQCYQVHVGTMDSFNDLGRNDFRFQIMDSDFPAANTWKTYQVNFPADGSTPGFQSDAPYSETTRPYNQTILTFLQGPQGAQPALAFNKNVLHEILFSAMNPGAFDLYISNVSFY